MRHPISFIFYSSVAFKELPFHWFPCLSNHSVNSLSGNMATTRIHWERTPSPFAFANGFHYRFQHTFRLRLTPPSSSSSFLLPLNASTFSCSRVHARYFSSSFRVGRSLFHSSVIHMDESNHPAATTTTSSGCRDSISALDRPPSTANRNGPYKNALRGRRRKNIADEDEIWECEKQCDTRLTSSSASSSSSFFSFSKWCNGKKDASDTLDSASSTKDLDDSTITTTTTAMPSPYTSTPSLYSSLFSSFTRTPTWWSQLLIRSLWVPYLGAAVAKCCEWGAWPLYIGGRVVFYHRPSTMIPTATCATGTGQDRSVPCCPSCVHPTSAFSALPPPCSYSSSSSCFPCETHQQHSMRKDRPSALYIGRSAIHGRGIFASVPLPRGTRLPLSGWWIAPPSTSKSSSAVGVEQAQHPSSCMRFSSFTRCFLPGPSHMCVFSDTYERLPDTLHYTHPTGKWLEVLLSQGDTPTSIPLSSATFVSSATSDQADGSKVASRRNTLVGSGSHRSFSHALLNHSCAPNVCSGLSTVFWPAALAADYCNGVRSFLQSSPREGLASMSPAVNVTAMAAKARLVSHIPPVSHSVSSSALSLSWFTKIATFEGFHDPNAFFTTRDIQANEELTIDYGCRVAPLYTTARRRYFSPLYRLWRRQKVEAMGCGLPTPSRAAREDEAMGRRDCSSFFPTCGTSTPSLLCRCGASSCRYRLYQPPPLLLKECENRLDSLLSAWQEHCQEDFTQMAMMHGVNENAENVPHTWSRNRQKKRKDDPDERTENRLTLHDDFRAAAALFARGYDEEGTVLSLLPSPTPLLQYLSGKPLTTLQCSFLFPSTLPPPLLPVRYSKWNFLLSYRHLFQGLNELSPQKNMFSKED